MKESTIEIAARAVALDTIENLYPPDKSEEGRHLLIDALCSQWQHLPTPILCRLATLCMDKEKKHNGNINS